MMDLSNVLQATEIFHHAILDLSGKVCIETYVLSSIFQRSSHSYCVQLVLNDKLTMSQQPPGPPR